MIINLTKYIKISFNKNIKVEKCYKNIKKIKKKYILILDFYLIYVIIDIVDKYKEKYHESINRNNNRNIACCNSNSFRLCIFG